MPAKTQTVDAKIAEAAEENIEKSREFFGKSIEMGEQSMKNFADYARVLQSGAEALGKKAYDNSVANTNATFDAVQSAVKAKDLSEFYSVTQADMKKASERTTRQMRDFFELFSTVYKDSFEAAKTAYSKTAEQFKVSA